MLRIDSVVRQPDGGSVLWTADVCLVDLDNAPQGFPVRRDHRSSQFMEHRPNRFVAVQAKLPLDSWSWNSQGGFGINRISMFDIEDPHAVLILRMKMRGMMWSARFRRAARARAWQPRVSGLFSIPGHSGLLPVGFAVNEIPS